MEDNMDSEIKAGDIVVLKSGGPEMTVEKVLPARKVTGERVQCTWFDGKEVQSRIFNIDSLKMHSC
jgi:uncharacterized protein YodC (DUF2158 family)